MGVTRLQGQKHPRADRAAGSQHASSRRSTFALSPTALRLAIRLLPLLLVCIALILRLYGYNFDDGQLVHPDELAVDEAVTRLGCCLGNPNVTQATWPSPLTNVLSATSAPYNPYFFNYGSLPIYLLAFVPRTAAGIGHIVPGLSSWRMASDLVHTNWIGRWLSAGFDVGTLVVLYRLGTRIFDRWVGLLAMTLGTFTVLEIQLSHFYAVDTILTFFVVLTLYFLVQAVETNSVGMYAVVGVSLGAALATKASSAPLLIPLFATPFIYLWTKGQPEAGALKGPRRADQTPFAWSRVRPADAAITAASLRLLTALIVCAVSFALFQPYGLIDHAQLLFDVGTQNGIIVTHTMPVPYTIQFDCTVPYLFYLKNTILWYLGPALGVTACLAIVVFVRRNVTPRFHPGEVILLLWVIPYFAVIGRFWAKFGRYMLPIVPLLTLFAAALLLLTVRQLSGRKKLLGRAVVAGVTACTVLWGLAFMHIYTVTNPQVAASNWIYRHLKPGTPFATEGAWDRGLPFCTYPTAGSCPPGYVSYQLNLFAPDGPSKISSIVHALTHDHYIVMSTQRFIDSIPLEPQTYPITNRYYQLLFHNRLNFRLVRRFAVHPQLGPWVIDDFPADENFTVFDHPDVRIFKRVSSISPGHARRLLDSPLEPRLATPHFDVPPRPRSRVPSTGRPAKRVAAAGRKPASVSLPPIDIGSSTQDSRLMLTAQQWREDQQAPSYDHMFPPHGFGMRHPLLLWLLLVEALGLLVFPLISCVCGRLADRGWIVSKTFGVILLGWVSWVVVSLGIALYSAQTIWLILAALTAVSAISWALGRNRIIRLFRKHWRGILLTEAVFLAGFAIFVMLRMWYPDLGHQFSPVSPSNVGAGRMGEKQLELAFLTSTARSRTFPPYDPFFAGGYINYYYFGYLLVATFCRALFIAPVVGFNLAIPMFFALLVGAAYSVGRTFSGSPLFGIVTAVFVGGIGNLNGLVQAVQDLQAAAQTHPGAPLLGGIAELASGAYHAVVLGSPTPSFDFWQSTRLLPPIGVDFAEFPFFTYLFGDLHAHLMAFPMDMAVIALSLNLVLEARRLTAPRLGASVLTAGLLLAAIQGTNPLDVPTFGTVFFVGLAAGFLRGGAPLLLVPRHRRRAIHLSFRQSLLVSVGTALGLSAAAVALGFVLLPPVTQGYHPVFNTGLALVAGTVSGVTVQTPLPVYLEMFALFLFPIFTVAAVLVGRARLPWRQGAAIWTIVFTLLAAAVLASLGHWLLAFLLGAVVLVGTALVARINRLPARVIWLLLVILLPLLLTAIAEIVFIPDYLDGGAAFRMNTVAKLYNQVWLLFAVGAAGSLALLWRAFGVRALLTRRSPVVTQAGGRLHPAFLTRHGAAWALWSGCLAVLVGGCLIYDVAGTVARETYRQTWLPENSVPLTLNGMAFMRAAYPGDYAGIRWLDAHVRGAPVILEADQADYNWRSRVVQFTGLPTLLGGIYEPAQRYASEVAPRQSVLEEIYSATPTTVNPTSMAAFHVSGCPVTGTKGARCLATSLLRAYHVSYVYVGLMERQLWPAGIGKFAQMPALHRVFEGHGVAIYHVLGSET